MSSNSNEMLVYLDNAATTFPKPRSVIESAYECVTEYCANPGRSVHRLAIKVSEKIYETRERVATYLKHFAEETQFVVITHKKVTMENADTLFGVTMEEKGVSKIVSVKLSDINGEIAD